MECSSCLFNLRISPCCGSTNLERMCRSGDVRHTPQLEMEERDMNDNFDRIRDIQKKLADLPCPSCGWHKQLALILRYAGHGACCLFIAYCKSCQIKYIVDQDAAPFIRRDTHGFSTNSLARNLSQHASLQEMPCNVAKK